MFDPREGIAVLQPGYHIVLVAAMLAAHGSGLSAAQDIETSYGEDPVPDAHRFNGSICLGYGVDPIPVRSPLERWTFWRSEIQENQRKHPSARSATSPASTPAAATGRPATVVPGDGPPRTPWWRFSRKTARPTVDR